MLINNTDIKTKYNMVLNEKKISPSKASLNLNWLKGSLTPILLYKETKFCDIECKFTIEAETEDEFELKFSELNRDIIECILKFDDINMFYKCYIEDAKEPERITPYNWEFTCKWIGYKFKKEIEETLNNILDKTINNPGNKETPCIIEITPNIGLVDLTISGLSNDPIIIKNLKQSKKIIIDGIEGTVLEEGINKFKDTDFWEFPFLLPGSNKITIDKNSCDINIKFKPRFI